MELLRAVRDSMGDLFPLRGMVGHEQYDKVKDALRQLKEHVFEQYAYNEEGFRTWDDVWPFDP